MELSEKLQQLRKEKGLTQEQLAEQIFVSRTAISKWESGRGYPSLDYLKSISKFFSVSIDDLFSDEELIKVAENNNHEKTDSVRTVMFGVIDCMTSLLLFLPFFSKKESDTIRAVSLLSLKDGTPLLTHTFIAWTSLIILFGIAELALQNVQHRVWLKYKTAISLFLGIGAVLMFISSPLSYAYAGAFMFFLLVLKTYLLLKRK
ncbi:MAG: helix-turn-helix domain-containing protein [Treponema sp.]|jgi:transcriptional regulator with XRE-family HTH domain|nr:helix-turn-helix domain-containing protein [Treponema sp.]